MKVYLTKSVKGAVSALRTDGRLLIPPLLVKEYVPTAIGIMLYPRAADVKGLWAPGLDRGSKLSISLEAPQFVLFCGLKSREQNAKKFIDIINEVEKIIGVDGKTTHHVPDEKAFQEKDCGPFVVTAPNWWVRSPVAVSAYLLMLRLSIRMHRNEDFADFRIRMNDSKRANHKDGELFRIADKAGNIDGLLKKGLPCLHREGYSDYLLTEHYRSISFYNALQDSYQPADETTLTSIKVEAPERMNLALKSVEEVS